MISLSSSRLKQINAGVGIGVTNGSGPTATVKNTGVITLTEGDNITIENPSEGEYVINSSGGGSSSSGITQISSGGGLSVTNGTGPHTTITNTGVRSLQAGDNIAVYEGESGVWTIDATSTDTITSVTGGSGITVTNGTGPTVSIANTGVLSLVSGTNTTANNLGDGGWRVDAASAITQIAGGTGMFVSNGTGPIVSVANTGVVTLTNGTNTTVSNSGTTWTVNVDNVVTGLQNGTNTTVEQVANGIWQVNSTGTITSPAVIEGGDYDMIINTSATANQYDNLLVETGDQVIYANSTGSASTLTLISKSSNDINAGVRIRPNELQLLCEGGISTQTPYTNSIVVGSTSIQITAPTNTVGLDNEISFSGAATFYDGIPTINDTISSSDDSKKIATTEWVQSKLTNYALSTYSYSDRKSTRLNSSHVSESRMPSSA